MTRAGSLKSCSSSSALITCQEPEQRPIRTEDREEPRAGQEEEEEEEEYLALAEVRSDSGRVDGFNQQHPEVIQLQPAEVILAHSLHPAVLVKVLRSWSEYRASSRRKRRRRRKATGYLLSSSAALRLCDALGFWEDVGGTSCFFGRLRLFLTESDVIGSISSNHITEKPEAVETLQSLLILLVIQLSFKRFIFTVWETLERIKMYNLSLLICLFLYL